MARRHLIGLTSLLAIAATAITAGAGDWMNSGGNAGRNALSDELGPGSSQVLWSGGRSSLIAWHPVTEGNRAFMIRQPRWPDQQPDDAFVVASDLTTGQELWAIVLPYQSGDWIPWIAGVKNGKVYASRSGNGASVSAPMYALDVADGHIVWTSTDETDAGAYDGVVFAADGDLLVGSFQDIWRIDGETGATLWHAPRVGSVSGSCGGALFGEAFYVADAAPGGHVLVRYNATTGARQYQSPLMPGFTIQNTPMVGPDGTVYLNRAQNNPSVDFYYAFTDNGLAFVEKWHVPGMSGADAELGVGPDGSVYVITSGPRLARLDPETGATIDETPVLAGFSKARMAIDAGGNVFFSNGAFATGRLYAYTASLAPIWDVPVVNINIGGPSLGENGTLVVCGIGTDVRAYRSGPPVAVGDPAAGNDGGPFVLAAPNPFRDETAISYDLDEAGSVRLELFDVRGLRVRTLVDGRGEGAGRHVVRWDGRSDAGEVLPSGVYYYRFASDGVRGSGRLLRTR